MDFTLFLTVAVIILIISFVGYVVTTNKIIREQDEQIQELAKQVNHHDKVTVEYIDSSIPKYGDF